MTNNDDDANAKWAAALEAVDRGELTTELEHAIVSAARRIKRRKKIDRRHDAQKLRDDLRSQTGRVLQQSAAASVTEPISAPISSPISSPVSSASPGDLPNHAHCYVCKQPYKTLHPFYHLLCVACGDASFARRSPELHLEGRRAILTGGRTKIGYRCALILLRAGASVTVTTRYPHDAARRFANEDDYEFFAERLRIERVDFRDIRAVHEFIDEEIRRGEPLDFLVNQAAQTIRSSANLERLEKERDRLVSLQLGMGEGPPRSNPAAAATTSFDALVTRSKGAIVKDADHGEWVDNNARNSWDLALEDVSIAEFFEVQLVNVFAPWSLTARLQPLMRLSRFPDRYVVQVSAIEGQFHGPEKSGKHPHTNMAKAALHMLVRTSAEPLAKEGIYMNAVDPGWVSDQSAIQKRKTHRSTDARFCPPLDTIDGAARVLDPITRGLKGDRVFGLFLKDYVPTSW